MKTLKDKRIVEFDIARGVAIILMIIQHVWLLLFSPLVNNSYLDFSFFILGTVLAAPAFLFLMGANVVNSHKSKPNQLFTRGLELVVAGYCLSALRFFLPIVLVQHFGLIANPETIIYKFPPLYYFLEVDIFQVAGLSLMAIALLKWRQVKYDYYLVVALIVALIAPLLWQITGSNYLFDPFWGKANYVVFPFFPWFFFPLIGVYFGNLLLKAKNKTDFYKSCFSKLIPVIGAGLLFLLVDVSFSDFSYSHHNVGASLIFVSITIYWLAIIYLNYQKLSVKVINILTILSKNVTLIYIVQWLVIAWGAIYLNIK